jgi:hypothetical protein
MITDRAGWLAFDGTEIINSARLAAYLAHNPCTPGATTICVPCPELIAEVSDPPFISPQDDSAPWYDPALPVSADFLGVGGIDIEGLWMQPSEVVDGVIVRDMSVRVVLAGRSEAAVSYGLAWLAQALNGSFCPTGSCVGGQMCVAVACPTENAPDPVRTLVDVIALEKPQVVQVWSSSGITWWEVEFVMRARNSGLYQESGISLTFNAQTGAVETVNLLEAYEGCNDVQPCATDPECPRPLIPEIPQPPIDACYPTEDFEAHRSIASIDGFVVPSWLELVPVITIRAGSTVPLRNVVFRFYQNPLGLDCTDLITVDPCAACTDITVLYVPPGGVTVIDGRTSRAQTNCLGGDVDVPALYGPGGRTFNWPTFSCGYGLCVEVLAAAGDNPEAEATVEFYTRWEAA